MCRLQCDSPLEINGDVGDAHGENCCRKRGHYQLTFAMIKLECPSERCSEDAIMNEDILAANK